MRHKPFITVCFAAAIAMMLSRACEAAGTPRETMATWYDALCSVSDQADGRVMEAMIDFYCGELQDKFMPEIDPILGKQDQWRYDKAMRDAADLHRKWAGFLGQHAFSRQSFANAQEMYDGDRVSLLVRSDKNVVRLFHLENRPGRGWVITKLESPEKLGAAIRVIAIIVAVVIAGGIVAKKFIFS